MSLSQFRWARATINRIGWAGSALLVATVSAVSQNTYAATPPAQVAPETRQKIAELKAIAIGEDRLAAVKAFDDLLALGDPARLTLTDSLRAVLLRDKALLEESIRKSAIGGEIGKLEADLAKQREAALERVVKLTPSEMNQARGEYTKLLASSKKVNDLYATRSTLIDLARVRPNLIALWTMVAPKGLANPIDPAAEQKLMASVKQALGEVYSPILDILIAKRTSPIDPEPQKPEQAGLLGYRARRLTDRYNKSLAASVDPAEMEVISLINTYRDVLGLPGFEIDLRLMQAARRHSKEMVDLKYFDVTSPTAENKDALTRMKSAGFPAAEPFSEALTRNFKTGTQVFWGMFDQPPYHQQMTAANTTAIGVGRWGVYWTVDNASGTRLATATPDERAAAAVQGEILPPQTAGATVARNTAGNSGNGSSEHNGQMTDPRNIKPRAPGGAGQVPGVGGIPSIGGF